MTLTPISTLLLGIILGCAVTTLIHSLTVSCVQCGSTSSRSLVGLDKFSSIYTSSDRLRVHQLGMIASESSCATLRLQLESVKGEVKGVPLPNASRRQRSAIDAKGTYLYCISSSYTSMCNGQLLIAAIMSLQTI